MAEPLRPKLTYRPQRKLEVFFTGGVARISRDGKLLACGCGEEVKIVDVETGSVLRTLAGDSEPVSALAISPDCKTLVVASRSCTCRVIDLTSGELKRSWRGHKAPIADVVVDASGGYVATAGADRLVKVWDLTAGFCTHSFVGHSGVVTRLLFHPKQHSLFSAGDDGEVRVWDLLQKQCVAQLQAHFSAVTSLTLSPDGWQLLSGGRDKVVVVWDLHTNAKQATVAVYEAVEGVVALPLGTAFPGVEPPPAPVPGSASKAPLHFATCGEKGRIKLWRADTGKCVYEHDAPTPTSPSAPPPSTSRELTDLALLPGGTGLMATTADARLLFYHTGKAAGQLHLTKQLVGNLDEVSDVRFVGGTSSQPSHIAVATNCEVLQVFDVTTLSCTASCEGHTDTVLALDAAFDLLPGGDSLVVSGAKDNEVRVWAVPSGRCLAVGVGHVGAVAAVALSRKQPGKLFVSGGADKLLKVWDLAAMLTARAEAEATARTAQEGLNAVDGQPVKKKKKKEVKAEQTGASLNGPSPIAVLALRASAAVAAHDKDINCVVVSPNDQLVASGSQDRTAKVWRLPSLTPVAVLRGHRRGVWCVEFSPVDQALLTSSGDKTIKLWSLADGGSCIRTFEGSQASVLRASFITAGTQVLSAGADGLVKLWSVKSGECQATYDEHAGKIWAMSTGGSQDSMLVTGGSDACVAVWADVTAADESAAEEAEEQLVQMEQQLANALAAADYVSAARLAFSLKHPGRLLAVVQRAASMQAAAALHLPAGAADGSEQQATAQQSVAERVQSVLTGLVAQLSPEEVRTALEYCREWNTNSRHCHAAQAMLKALLRHSKPAQLMGVPGIQELTNALLAYSLRHAARVDRLLRSSFLLDYTLASMQVLSPEGEVLAEEPGTASPSGHPSQLGALTAPDPHPHTNKAGPAAMPGGQGPSSRDVGLREEDTAGLAAAASAQPADRVLVASEARQAEAAAAAAAATSNASARPPVKAMNGTLHAKPADLLSNGHGPEEPSRAGARPLRQQLNSDGEDDEDEEGEDDEDEEGEEEEDGEEEEEDDKVPGQGEGATDVFDELDAELAALGVELSSSSDNEAEGEGEEESEDGEGESEEEGDSEDAGGPEPSDGREAGAEGAQAAGLIAGSDGSEDRDAEGHGVGLNAEGFLASTSSSSEDDGGASASVASVARRNKVHPSLPRTPQCARSTSQQANGHAQTPTNPAERAPSASQQARSEPRRQSRPSGVSPGRAARGSTSVAGKKRRQ